MPTPWKSSLSSSPWKRLLPLGLLLPWVACGDSEPTAPDPGPNALPCDVKDVLARRCAQCHASPPTSGAPAPLLSRADLQKGSSLYPGTTWGERSVARMKDSGAPMPPTSEPSLTHEERDLIEHWVQAGMPAGSCGALPTGQVATSCGSGSFWTDSAQASATMAPGLACRDCHLRLAPDRAYFFMGTVFPSFHEKDACNAPPPADARVELLDSAGRVQLTLTPNAAGNFLSAGLQPAFALPYRARVTAQGRVREMNTLQRSGDCNTCHTEQGNHDAPGRIVWP
ncbi:hypothetical protein DRW03_20175 [Corallococcus sp. H22C18031201]|nr:hypothetical protein DRW03_20175 [Corallococcus sp. H22C18031201]